MTTGSGEAGGATVEFRHRVDESDTAVALGSGDVPVLGTPRVLALVEAATVRLMSEVLPADRTSVGVEVSLRHLAPSRVGETVLVRAHRRPGDGSRVSFDVEVRQPEGRLLADGVVVRAIAARERFA